MLRYLSITFPSSIAPAASRRIKGVWGARCAARAAPWSASPPFARQRAPLTAVAPRVLRGLMPPAPPS